MEVVRKYNQELKLLKSKDKDNSNSLAVASASASNHLSTISTQTMSIEELKAIKIETSETFNSKELSQFKLEILNIKQILNNSKSENEKTASDSINLAILLNEVELLAKSQNKNVVSLKFEVKSLRDQNAKLNNEIKLHKEAKSKLETLYKIKCKSDLNKSAQIKKLELNYENELIKLRNEFNYDLVAYLKSKLNQKDSLLTENFYQLNNLLDLIKNSTSSAPTEFLGAKKNHELQSNSHNQLLKIKTFLENLIDLNSQEKHNNDMIVINNLSNDGLNLNLDNIYKMPPVNVVYKFKAPENKNSVRFFRVISIKYKQ